MLVNALEARIYLCWSSPGKIYSFWASGGSAVWHLPGSTLCYGLEANYTKINLGLIGVRWG